MKVGVLHHFWKSLLQQRHNLDEQLVFRIRQYILLSTLYCIIFAFLLHLVLYASLSSLVSMFLSFV